MFKQTELREKYEKVANEVLTSFRDEADTGWQRTACYKNQAGPIEGLEDRLQLDGLMKRPRQPRCRKRWETNQGEAHKSMSELHRCTLEEEFSSRLQSDPNPLTLSSCCATKNGRFIFAVTDCHSQSSKVVLQVKARMYLELVSREAAKTSLQNGSGTGLCSKGRL